MQNTGVLLAGLSLLTLAIIITLSKSEVLLSAINNSTYVTLLPAYILIGVVFFGGIFLIYTGKQK